MQLASSKWKSIIIFNQNIPFIYQTNVGSWIKSEINCAFEHWLMKIHTGFSKRPFYQILQIVPVKKLEASLSGQIPNGFLFTINNRAL